MCTWPRVMTPPYANQITLHNSCDDAHVIIFATRPLVGSLMRGISAIVVKVNMLISFKIGILINKIGILILKSPTLKIKGGNTFSPDTFSQPYSLWLGVGLHSSQMGAHRRPDHCHSIWSRWQERFHYSSVLDEWGGASINYDGGRRHLQHQDSTGRRKLELSPLHGRNPGTSDLPLP